MSELKCEITEVNGTVHQLEGKIEEVAKARAKYEDSVAKGETAVMAKTEGGSIG